MSNTETETGKSRHIFKRLGIAGGGGLLLVVFGYLFATSGTFVKSFVLPKVSQQLNAKVTVSDASVGVFSGVTVKDLEVRSDDTSLVKAKSASFKYSFWNLISGRVRVSEFTLDSPEVLVIRRADSSSNLDPIVQAMEANQAPAEPGAPAGGKVDVLIKNVSLKNARFRFEQTDKAGIKTMMEAAEVMIDVDQFGSGIEGTLKMSTRLAFAAGPTGQTPVDELQARIASEFKFAFDPELKPETLVGSGSLDVTEATGTMVDVKGLNGSLAVDLDGMNLKQLALNFHRATESLGKITVAGPLDFVEKGTGTVRVEINDIGKSVLNLAGAPLGLSFGNTTVSSSLDLSPAFGGDGFGVAGLLKLGAFTVKQGGRATPPIDLDFDYALKAHTARREFELSKFSFAGTQNAKKVLSANLDQPFLLSLPEGADPKIGDATFTAKATGLDLGPWSGMTGGQLTGGIVDLDASIASKDAGNNVSLVLVEKIRGLGVAAGTNVFSGIDSDTEIRLAVANLKELALEIMKVNVTHQGRELLALSAAGKADLKELTADMGTMLNLDLAKALQMNPVPGVNIPAGQLSFAGRLASSKSDAGARQGIDGSLTVSGLSGNAAGYAIDRFGTEITLAASVTDLKQLVVEKLNAPLTMAGQSAGVIHVTANATLDGKTANASVTTTNLNENLFRPFLEPLLAGARLADARLDLNLNLAMTADGKKTVKGDLNLGNLTIADPSGRIPAQPISLIAALAADATGEADTVRFQLPICNGAVMVGGQDAGNFDVAGSFDAASQKGEFKAELAGINQNLLIPFTAGALGDKRLQTVAINGGAQGKFDLKNSSEFKANLSVSDLVIIDPSGQIPATPLAVSVGANGVMTGKQLELKDSSLKLAPTERADNQLKLSGRVDFSDPAALSANLLLAANTLDFTQYYDLFAGGSSAPAPSPTPAPSAPPAVDRNEEPPPITLPIKNSRIETRIGRLYLREIEVTNLLVTAAIDRQSIKVSPLQLAVNGGPINGSADLQLGVPGSRYDIRFNVDRVPIRPALQSFSPTIGQTARGEIVADLRVAGTGQTGRSLRQSLNGTFSFYLTNAMIKLTPDSQPVQSSAQSGLLSSFKGAGQEFMSSGLSSIAGVLGIPDLTRSPITHIATVVEMGGGAINLRNADVRSSMFMVHAAGSIPIQDVLTNSPLKIPVDVWLSKSAASRLTLGGGNEPFSKLPTFVEMRGTLGAPETFIDKTVTAQIVGSAALGLLKGTGGDLGKAAESMLKGGAGDIGGALGGLFGGGKKPPAGGNQQPQKGFGGALGGLFGGQPKKQTPQQPGTTKTNTPGKNPFELFNLIPKK